MYLGECAKYDVSVILSASFTFVTGTVHDSIQWLVMIWLVSSAVCDTLIAGAISFSLFLSRGGFKAWVQFN